MAETYKVVANVVSQEGSCAAGHKVGDEWLLESHSPAGMCGSAFNAIFPSIRVLRFGGIFPWSDDPDSATVACPDAKNPVVIRLRRVRE
jgi:uncharacterized repeat protein (TIGR04076 family)